MPINTENKRRSVGCNPFLVVLPVPDGKVAEDNQERMHIAWLYAGNAIVSVAGDYYALLRRSKVRS